MSQGPHRESLLLPVVIPLGALAVIATVLFGFSRILLGISHTAATVTACVVAITTMQPAGWQGWVSSSAESSSQRLMAPCAVGSSSSARRPMPPGPSA